jgi:transcriptional regulator with XRE-family HTH domain
MVGDVLKSIREENNLTQDDIAIILNIKRQTYSSYERNKSLPDINALSKLADYYNTSTDYLLGRTNIRNYIEYNDLIMSNKDLTEDEQQLLDLYRKLSITLKAELRGEIKGILRNTKQEQSSCLNNSGNDSSKKAI